MQELELNLLQAFHDVCIKHNLRYSLIYGTLLGAVRHKGFIPWDDDVDVMMPREDYKKLLNLPVEAFGNEYRLCAHETTKGYIHPIAKLIDTRTVLREKISTSKAPDLGLYIDIFPADRIPKDDLQQKKFHKVCCVNARNLAFTTLKFHTTGNKVKDIFKRIILGSYHLRGPQPFLKKLDKIIAYSESLESEILKIIVFPEDKRNEVFEKEFDDLIEMEFQGEMFCVLRCYERLLKSSYGDYMKLPPEEERVSNHDTIVKWK